jgi:hypothetical protein
MVNSWKSREAKQCAKTPEIDHILFISNFCRLSGRNNLDDVVLLFHRCGTLAHVPRSCCDSGKTQKRAGRSGSGRYLNARNLDHSAVIPVIPPIPGGSTAYQIMLTNGRFTA